LPYQDSSIFDDRTSNTQDQGEPIDKEALRNIISQILNSDVNSPKHQIAKEFLNQTEIQKLFKIKEETGGLFF